MEFECQETIRVSEKSAFFVVNACKEQQIDQNQVDSNTKIEKAASSKLDIKFSCKKGILAGCSQKSSNDVLPNGHRSMSDLPAALISEILDCLGPKDLGIISCVSTNLHRLASEHHVWKQFYCERWGLPAIPATIDAGLNNEKSWRDLFVEREFRMEGIQHLFDLRAPQNQNTQFRLWEHEGPITSVALDLTRIYSGSWDMTVRIWDRFSRKCLNVLRHSDWVWALVPHDATVASSSGSDVTNKGASKRSVVKQLDRKSLAKKLDQSSLTAVVKVPAF
ncbi:hypothetical protein G4B88_025879 [Cannabis sativa]|uniref:F-box domain-containing protein n=1 Tax=Cannabis sativa TaxID=3483 RepID=A0A7J6HHP9_CANSA|nr:hypothetical protein G4B88_025879 [Cannabis sativa]